MTALLITAIAVYALTSCALFAFGLNLASASLRAWRGRDAGEPSPPVGAKSQLGGQRRVTVQLPLYNEPFVARRVIEAACALDYPRHLLQIQVLDDSTDQTSSIAARAVAEARRAGIDIDLIRRDHRHGFKAGALAAGLEQATGSLIAIFDADFVPPTDFLQRSVPHFSDDSVAFVQGRWGHLNSDQSWLTKLQVPAVDGHFLVEQKARGLAGHWFNFNGTAGIWRAEAILDAGGWHHDTLTEDLDLSYRAHLRGWRGIYLPDLVVPGELPSQLSGFRSQQRRWARGSLECAAKLLGPVWRSPASLGVKLQATAHLLAYTIHLLLIVLLLTYPLVLAATARLDLSGLPIGIGFIFAPAALAPALFMTTGQALQRGGLPRRLPAVAGMIVFGSGLMVNTARAALDIMTKPNPTFERTAKFGLATEPAPNLPRRSRQPIDRAVLGEVALGLYALGTAALAFSMGSWGIFGYATLFSVGLFTVATTTIAGSLRTSHLGELGEQPSTSASADASIAS